MPSYNMMAANLFVHTYSASLAGLEASSECEVGQQASSMSGTNRNLGVPTDSPWIVFEFMPFGDLVDVLRSNSGIMSLQRDDLPILKMVKWSSE